MEIPCLSSFNLMYQCDVCMRIPHAPSHMKFSPGEQTRVNPQLKIVLFTSIHLLLQISLLRMTLFKRFIVLRASYTAIIFLDLFIYFVLFLSAQIAMAHVRLATFQKMDVVTRRRMLIYM